MPNITKLKEDINILSQFRKEADINNDGKISLNEGIITMGKQPKYLSAFVSLIAGILTLLQVIYASLSEYEIDWIVLTTTIFIAVAVGVIYFVIKLNAQSSEKVVNLIHDDHVQIILKKDKYIEQLEKKVDEFKDMAQGFKGKTGLLKFALDWIKENNSNIKVPDLTEP